MLWTLLLKIILLLMKIKGNILYHMDLYTQSMNTHNTFLLFFRSFLNAWSKEEKKKSTSILKCSQLTFFLSQSRKSINVRAFSSAAFLSTKFCIPLDYLEKQCCHHLLSIFQKMKITSMKFSGRWQRNVLYF